MGKGQWRQGAVLAVGLAAALSGCVRGKEPERVALTFAWPEALDAQVEQQVERVDTGKEPIRYTLRYRMDSRRSETGQRVAFSNATFDPRLPPGLEAATRPGLELTHVLDLDGEVARVEGFERAFEAMRKLPSVAQSTPQQLQLVRELGEKAVLQQARGRWDSLVGRWAGRRLALGREEQREGEVAIGVLPGNDVPTQERLALRRRVPCREGGPLSCVELWSRSESDPAAMGEALRSLFEQLEEQGAKPLRLPEGVQVGIVTDEVLVAEPDTLVPHALTVRKTTRMPDFDAAEPRVMERVEVQTFRFSHGPLPVKRTEALSGK